VSPACTAGSASASPPSGPSPSCRDRTSTSTWRSMSPRAATGWRSRRRPYAS
jgi:hypothetical protein